MFNYLKEKAMQTFNSLGNWYAALTYDDEIYIEDCNKIIHWHPGALIITDVGGCDNDISSVSYIIQADDLDNNAAVLGFIGHRLPGRLFADLEDIAIEGLGGYAVDGVRIYRREYALCPPDTHH